MVEMIPFTKPNITEEDIQKVVEVLREGWLTYGYANEEFEAYFANYVGVKRAVTLNSCTSALHLSLLANRIKPGDEVLVPSFTFPATANAVLHCGAKPIFVDSNLGTFNMDAEDAQKKITAKTKAIIPVHFAGLSCDMQEIMEISEVNNLKVIEDAAQALGSEFEGKKVGSFGVGCFSFFPTKHITTGEGGIVTTDDDIIADEISKMSAHGIEKSTWARSYAKFPWQRIQTILGFSYRMSNFQAALGLEQMKRLDENLNKRVKIANKISRLLEDFDFIVPQVLPKNCRHSYHIYTVRIIGKNRRTFLEKLHSKGIGASIHFDPPVHLQPFYINMYGKLKLPKAEEISNTILTLPLYPDMTNEELNKVLNGIELVCKDIEKSESFSAPITE